MTITLQNKPDRLSALLHGLAPRVDMQLLARQGPADASERTQQFDAQADPMLYLNLINDSPVSLRAGQHTVAAQAPALLVCSGDLAHTLDRRDGAPRDAVLTARAWLTGPVAPLLLAEFTRPWAVPLGDADESLAKIISLVRGELLEPRCGHPALLTSAGDIIFITLLRHLVAHADVRPGLFLGLADPRIAKVLVALHSQPDQHWTLQSLAACAGMSRTAFAVRFKETLQSPPGKYLSRLRLQIARRAVQSGQSLKTAARTAGFGNASALSRALSVSKPAHPIHPI